MRAIGLAALLFGALAFLLPIYRLWVPAIELRVSDAQMLGGLLVAVGGLTLAFNSRS